MLLKAGRPSSFLFLLSSFGQSRMQVRNSRGQKSRNYGHSEQCLKGNEIGFFQPLWRRDLISWPRRRNQKPQSKTEEQRSTQRRSQSKLLFFYWLYCWQFIIQRIIWRRGINLNPGKLFGNKAEGRKGGCDLRCNHDSSMNPPHWLLLLLLATAAASTWTHLGQDESTEGDGPLVLYGWADR